MEESKNNTNQTQKTKKQKKKRPIRRFFLVLIVLYLAICTCLFFMTIKVLEFDRYELAIHQLMLNELDYHHQRQKPQYYEMIKALEFNNTFGWVYAAAYASGQPRVSYVYDTLERFYKVDCDIHALCSDCKIDLPTLADKVGTNLGEVREVLEFNHARPWLCGLWTSVSFASTANKGYKALPSRPVLEISPYKGKIHCEVWDGNEFKSKEIVFSAKEQEIKIRFYKTSPWVSFKQNKDYLVRKYLSKEQFYRKASGYSEIPVQNLLGKWQYEKTIKAGKLQKPMTDGLNRIYGRSGNCFVLKEKGGKYGPVQLEIDKSCLSAGFRGVTGRLVGYEASEIDVSTGNTKHQLWYRLFENGKQRPIKRWGFTTLILKEDMKFYAPNGSCENQFKRVPPEYNPNDFYNKKSSWDFLRHF